MAFQSLTSDRNRRWVSILIELGSSNLNFGTEATSLLLTQLALQAGPRFEDDNLRIHNCFRDHNFCGRLIEQIDIRLTSIMTNWREIYCMELLLTLILRLCSISSGYSLIESRKLLEKARATTLRWTRQLRSEIQASSTAETSRRCSEYAFRSALLCRRSFTLHATNAQSCGNQDIPLLDKAALRCFIECSVTFQDNMPSEPAALPLFFKNMLIRDLKTVYRMGSLLRRSLEAEPDSVHEAVNNVWPLADGTASRQFSSPTFIPPTSEYWIKTTVYSTLHTKEQTIFINVIEGHLLVDGQPLGKLPAHHAKSMVLGQLFGNQSLLTYPSSLRGMTYALAFVKNGHQIHIGLRQGTLIVQACVRGTILELIPQNVFGGAKNFDLPDSLVEHCVHWLDINTGILEIRQQPDIWIAKHSNWTLDFKSRLAYRRRSMLVDPHSPPFRRITQIFDRFEYRGRLTIFQPEKGNLTVELRRLELSFFINSKGLLECRQLSSEIDPSQDAGTWYGLNSKIILRDMINPQLRSIIVPIGQVKHNRDRFHVSIDIDNDGHYGKFSINEVIGRLDCPPEPRLLYLKAHLHACTSFVISDPLTGRNGSEEALHCLRAGYCQPWTPLNLRTLQILGAIAKITPTRGYYPKDAKRMQQISWDPQLTPTIQHDELRPAVEKIYEKSRLLELFAATKSPHDSVELEHQEYHLSYRSALRRGLYQRSTSQIEQVSQDLQYAPRGAIKDSKKRQNVYESVSLVRSWPVNMHTTTDLPGILQIWPSFGGLDHDYDPALLTGLLNMSPADDWGAMVNLCRHSGKHDMHRLMFLFATIAYGDHVDMDTLRVWIAFAVIEDLKLISPPTWSAYTDFRYNYVPSTDHFIHLVDGCRVPYPGDERDLLGVKIGYKMLRKLQNDQHRHEQLTIQHRNVMVESLLEQWPCSEPKEVGSNEALLLDITQAMNIIRPEWLRLFQNLELSSFLEKVQRILTVRHALMEIDIPKPMALDQEFLSTGSAKAGVLPTLPELMCRHCPISLAQPSITEVTKITTFVSR